MGPDCTASRRRLVALLGLLLAAAPAAAAPPGTGPVTHDDSPGGEDPLEGEHCAGGDDVCASGTGSATGDEAALSAKGDARCREESCSAASATGDAEGDRAASATGDATGHVAASAKGDAECDGGDCTAASGTGDAEGFQAASGTGEAEGPTALHKDTPRQAAESVLEERETGGEPDEPSWGDPGEAALRPGAPVAWEGCTANFVFTEEETGAVLLGTAAHCLERNETGDKVAVGGEAVDGLATLAYSGWEALEEADASGPCATERAQDFALLRIPENLHDEVHPSVQGWGGPVDVRERAESGEQVFMHGASQLREDEADSLEGVALGNDECLTEAVIPGFFFGDSGAPVLASDGSALGVFARRPPLASVTNVHQAAEFAEEHGNLSLELETWPRAQEGLVQDPRDGPSLPPWTPAPSGPAVDLPVDGREEVGVEASTPLGSAWGSVGLESGG